MGYLLPDLLGLDPINDGVQHRWSKHADISQQDVNMRWNVMTKPLSQDREDGRSIKENDDADMGATRVESLVMNILGREVEESMENQNVGNKKLIVHLRPLLTL